MLHFLIVLLEGRLGENTLQTENIKISNKQRNGTRNKPLNINT